MPKQKKGIRGKKGEANPYAAPPSGPNITNVNVTVKNKEKKKFFEKGPGKIILLIGIIAIGWAVLFAFTDLGQLFLANAGVYAQGAIALVTSTTGNIKGALTNPGETFGTFNNPDAARLENEERGVKIKDFSATRNYQQGNTAELVATITIQNIANDEILPLTFSCYPKSEEQDETKTHQGLITIPALGITTPQTEQTITFAPLPTNDPTILTIPALRDKGSYDLKVFCTLPETTGDNLEYTGENTLLSMPIVMRADYKALTTSTLKVFVSPAPYSSEQQTNLETALRAQGIPSKNGKLGAVTQGGPLDLQAVLEVSQPITPGSFPQADTATPNIPLTLGLTDSRGWEGQLTELERFAIIQLPSNFIISRSGCKDFTPVAGGAELNSEIITQINQCITNLQTENSKPCIYNPTQLRTAFTCQLELRTFGENPSLSPKELRIGALYTYTVDRDGIVNYLKKE